MSRLSNQIGDVDLIRGLSAIRSRWKLMVVLTLTGIAASVATDLRILSGKPDQRVVVESNYEGRLEFDELQVADIDPSLLSPDPSIEAQIELLKSTETQERLQKKSGSLATVEITYIKPKFTILETLDETNNRVSFLASGIPIYSFSCLGNDITECDNLLTLFVQEAESLRRDATKRGLASGASLIDRLIDESATRLQAGEFSPEESLALVDELAALRIRSQAIAIILQQVDGKLSKIGEDVRPLETLDRSVRLSSIGFGALVGLLIGLLLALQLGVMDGKIRTASDIAALKLGLKIIGSKYPRTDELQARSVAAAILNFECNQSSIVAIWALDDRAKALAQDVSNRAANSIVLTNLDQDSLSTVLNNSCQGLLVIITAGKTTKRDVIELIGLGTSANADVIGVALA